MEYIPSQHFNGTHNREALIRRGVLTYVEKSLKLLNISQNECRMAELGNIAGFSKFRSLKEYFISIGVKHDSFDWNGKDGAIKVDLAKPLKLEEYDIVTNLGTSEHVHNQYYVFNNIHNMCKANGVMIHSVPFENSWPKHCNFYYSVDFFKKLSEECNYKIILNEVDRIRGDQYELVTAILQKKENSQFVPNIDELDFAKELGIIERNDGSPSKNLSPHELSN